jgi:hypothetical protein
MKKVQKAMDDLGLPGTGGSDAHKILNIGSCVTIFEHPIRSEEDFLREVRAGGIRAQKRQV